MPARLPLGFWEGSFPRRLRAAPVADSGNGADQFGWSGGIDQVRGEVEQHSHRNRGRYAIAQHRAQVEQIARSVHDDAGYHHTARPAGKDHLDRIVVGSLNAPQRGRCAMRRQCAVADTPRGGKGALGERARRAREGGDVWMQGHEKPAVDGPVPRRLGYPQTLGIATTHHTVVPEGKGLQLAKVHAPTGYGEPRRPAKRPIRRQQMGRPGPGVRDQAFPEARSGRSLPRIRGADRGGQPLEVL